MKRPTESIQTLFFLNIILLAVTLLAIHATLNAFQIKSRMEEQVKETLEARTGEIAEHLDKRLQRIEEKTLGLALGISNLPTYDTEPMFRMERTYIASDPLICGGGIWFEPYRLRPQSRLGLFYFREEADDSIHIEDEYSGFDYFYEDWYKNAPARMGSIAWTGPYVDGVTQVTMLTTTAIFERDGKKEGAVTLDIGTEDLETYLRGVRIGAHGHAFLMSQEGYYLGHRDEARNMKQNIKEDSDPAVVALGRRILAAKELFLEDMTYEGVDSYIMAAPLTTDRLKLVLVAPKSDYAGAIWQALFLSVIMTLVVIVILSFAIRIIFRRRIGTPIRDLVESSEKIANGSDASFAISSQDEIGYLAQNLQGMAQKLKERNDMLIEQNQALEEQAQRLAIALQNVESMRSSRDAYKAESETDRLTKLLNKATAQRLAGEALFALAPQRLAALFIVDLDHFKEANDTYGHQHGDLVLQGFAAALRRDFRPNDIVGRFGGDEFVAFLTDLPDRGIIERKAQLILKEAAELSIDGRNAAITASIGIAIAPAHGTDYETLFQAADKALYNVKIHGRNGYSISGEESVGRI